ncbi:UDP-N,N'-diacetylbacillosamine 2-epimerase (hydrolyzing) [Clostridium haemolyticum]|uniref:UDP-N-acetyl-D-glucosamine 2-epimerase, UDP-hydrolysing n=1 Tax=Clostridium botulinum D str. 1873 TaxID=592027 RepID=A0A9P2G699_CLOBO|nr:MULTISPECIES: UDP-N-acetylglucosamine 2-epimerase [Clostridium]MCD3216718.1 UDP-N-acetylglucosamine 2-epimerase (hydrolyzing) [Clostridium botulinum C]AYF55130.1 UDP-N-acetylglucosamine 2-epimerase (hydrolyzing) [Clostridium novyi]EES90750.1 UDP-N-acetyl-D-glucosamine 2-epimerase, UDP-hydrolysing [Clostridium botulinum D str. 1873]MBO3441691.1 UDP-N-acetylglucosamine 2-epimerase (hydrolyzing) [Clostridium haemolyticum]MCD3244566.1 UDP-N-acetylglucosamine 2-epimerase (hydrolyzing) [Clostridi
MNRKIAVITGTRADYGIYYSVLKAIENHKDLELHLIVCGMHLSPEFGMTINEIEKDGFKIDDKIDTILSSDSGEAMAKSIGITLMGLTQSLDRIKPDVLLILGDRGEMMAGALAAIHMNIPVAHIHGGEVTGTVDESIRHSITKLSHIHFPANEDSRERIIKMGEEKKNVYVVGAPGIDYIKNTEYLSREEVLRRFNLKDDKIFILTQHPVTTEKDMVVYQIEETLSAIAELGVQTIISYPNSDNGGREIIKVIEKYREKYDFLKVFKNLSQVEYLSLLNTADIMIGNSSSGIIEAPSFKLPVINIGTRQQGRLRACNIIDVSYNRKEILSAIDKVLYNEEFKKELKKCENPYGDGHSGERIADILSKVDINHQLIQKRITY